jgi:hypothetical protein
MMPVVVVSRTLPGDAFIYSRYSDRERTHSAQLDSVPVGMPLPVLRPEDVELLRTDPEKLLK